MCCFKRRLDSYYTDFHVCLCDIQAQPQSTDQSSILWQHRLTSGAGLHSVTHSDTRSGSPLPVAFRRDQRPVSVCHSGFVPVLPSRWENGGVGGMSAAVTDWHVTGEANQTATDSQVFVPVWFDVCRCECAPAYNYMDEACFKFRAHFSSSSIVQKNQKGSFAIIWHWCAIEITGIYLNWQSSLDWMALCEDAVMGTQTTMAMNFKLNYQKKRKENAA